MQLEHLDFAEVCNAELPLICSVWRCTDVSVFPRYKTMPPWLQHAIQPLSNFAKNSKDVGGQQCWTCHILWFGDWIHQRIRQEDQPSHQPIHSSGIRVAWPLPSWQRPQLARSRRFMRFGFLHFAPKKTFFLSGFQFTNDQSWPIT